MNSPIEKNEIFIKKTIFHYIFEFFRDWSLYLIIFVMIGFFIAAPFKISGKSMENSFYDGEYLIIDKFSYLNFNTHFNEYLKNNPDPIIGTIAQFLKKIPIHIGDPKRGDVVVVRPHVTDMAKFYLKRIIALPGETIRFEDGKVFIKKNADSQFVEIVENYLSDENKNETYLPFDVDQNEFTVPEGKYWVIGDNRRFSSDSRGCFYSCTIEWSTHFIDRQDVVGRVWLSFWVFDWKNFSWKVSPRLWNIPSTYSYSELQ